MGILFVLRYMLHSTYYYYKLAHTAYVSDDGTTLQPTDEGLQPAPATISSYTYDHTDEAVLSPYIRC